MFRVAFLLFPGVTQLDLTGPYEVLARAPEAEVYLVWKSRDPVRTDRGLTILPSASFADCPPVDLICIPGGGGVNKAMLDAEALAFVRRMAAQARYVTSVCTGSLLLGAAGLIAGKRVGCHWMSRDLLREFGAMPTDSRVVIDANLITGGGVTAGIDFALSVVAEIFGRETAEKIQLSIEYDPVPPFNAGSPATAPAAIVDAVRQAAAAMMRERTNAVMQAAQALNAG
jgi:cyclohexyl-isocyanide hydratase